MRSWKTWYINNSKSIIQLTLFVLLQQLCGLCVCVYVSEFLQVWLCVCTSITWVCVQGSACGCYVYAYIYGCACMCVWVCSLCVYEIRWAHCSTMNGNHTASSQQPCVTYWNPNKRWSVIVHTDLTHTYTHTVAIVGDAELLWNLNPHVSLPGELMFWPK